MPCPIVPAPTTAIFLIFSFIRLLLFLRTSLLLKVVTPTLPLPSFRNAGLHVGKHPGREGYLSGATKAIYCIGIKVFFKSLDSGFRRNDEKGQRLRSVSPAKAGVQSWGFKWQPLKSTVSILLR